jgi:membrane-associated phospholipid phosphatase
LWLHWRFTRLRVHAAARLANLAWCLGIAWSTLAIRQHVALDVIAGAALGALGAYALQLKTHAWRSALVQPDKRPRP